MSKTTTAAWKFSASTIFKLSVITSAVSGLGMMTGCTASPTVTKSKGSYKGYQSTKQLGLLDASSLDSLEDLLSATDMRAVEGDRLLILKHGDVWKRMTVGFKMDETRWDSRIEAQRSWFVSRQPYLERLSARASRYLYHTVKEAERRGLPTELALLPVIESSYDPAATSSAAAAGLWQFIPSTGRIYGLRQTSLYDGRRDVVESTRAAYEFLGSLYNQFGSWELALAAYNAGPGRIQQAINRNKAAGLPTDYWSLKLPQETMNYVPRFLAVAQIIKSPQQYGVNLPPIANRPHFREVSVPAGASLSDIANVVGMSRAEFYQLNPGHRGEVVDPQSTQKVLIPAHLNPAIDARLKTLKANSTALWAASSSPSTTTPTLSSAATLNPPSSSSPTSTVGTLSAASKTAATAVVPSTVKNQPVYSAKNNVTPPTTAAVVKPATAVVTPVTPAASTIATSKSATPKGSEALAAFAASAVIPSAPRIPVAVTPAQNVTPVQLEPAISNEEKEKLLATLVTEKVSSPVSADKLLASALEPQASEAEKAEVVKELQALAPKGTEIVDPLDGKIKLTAIQTSQSVALEKGNDVKVGFSYPKAVAESTSPTSAEAKLNQGKEFAKTESEVVVVPPKGKRSTYTVLPGDTLAIIAMKNGVNWRDIAKWNQVDPNATLYVGATLYLYDANPLAAAKKVEEQPSSYVVKANDSLTGVATQFNLTVQQLAEYNGLSPSSNLLVGQKLNLIKPSGTAARGTNSTTKQSESSVKVETKSYLVKRGEYLKLIADRFALSNQELAALTPGLKADSSLYAGQKINVPLHEVHAETAATTTKVSPDKAAAVKAVLDSKTESYKVQRGDTLYNIANAHKLTVLELATLNSLDINRGLSVGQSIKVPAGNKLPEQYVVQSGDSLNGVASKYNLSVVQLAEMNDLSANAGLRVGQKLKLKADESEPGKPTQASKATLNNKSKVTEKEETHTVASGETLALIARKYQLELNELTELNDLSTTSVLRVGQTLKIKATAEKSKSDQKSASNRTEATVMKVSSRSTKATEAYTVKAGESFNAIANRFGLSAKELADLNHLKVASGLQRGQVIQVPKTVSDYKIRSGDSLYRIANKYGIDTAELAEMNGLKPNSPLQVGATLKVPQL